MRLRRRCASNGQPAAIILAAGRGGRLRPHTEDLPKALLDIGGRALLDHQLRALRLAGVHRIEVVTGFGADAIRKRGGGVSYSLNPSYATSDSFHSLGCSTLESNAAGILVLNSDVLFHPQLLRRLIADARENVLLCDFRSVLGEEEMKIVVDRDQRLVGISKVIDPGSADAENVGVLKLSQSVAQRMIELSRDGAASAGLRWVPDAIHAFRHEYAFWALPVGGLPWIEIDTADDLERARRSVYPRVAAALWNGHRPSALRYRGAALSSRSNRWSRRP